MTEDTGFKHISVAADNEEEIVIQAGVGAPSVKSQVVEPASVQDSESAPKVTTHDDNMLGNLSEAEREEYERHLRQREARNRELRMETTEEDLHVKMPFVGMQRTIVIVLALLAVAAIVYWLSRHPLG